MEADSTITINTGKTVTLAAFTREMVFSRGGILALDGNRIATTSPLVVTAGGLTINEGAELRNNLSGGGLYNGGTFTVTPPAALTDIYGNTPDQVYP
jgi:hypothetical protein